MNSKQERLEEGLIKPDVFFGLQVDEPVNRGGGGLRSGRLQYVSIE